MGQRRTLKGRCPMAERDSLDVRIKELIEKYPSFGYRRVWALLRFKDGLKKPSGSSLGGSCGTTTSDRINRWAT